VTFIPDLLNVPGVVNARNIGPNYIVAVGPARSGARPIRSVRHEYLHFLLDPLFEKYAASFPEAEPFLKRVNELPAAQDRYRNNFSLLLTESLLQMVEIRLDKIPEEGRTAALLDAYDRGLILAPYFLESLRSFEQRTESMPEVFQSLIEGIRWDVESKRGESILQLRAEPGARAIRTATSSGSQTRELLDEANRCLTAREYDKARGLLEQVLQLDPDNASALFGLGQIASQEQAFERALDLFNRAAEKARQEAWIAAWSYVRRGNIYSFLEKPDEAKAEWTRALQLQGDLRGAAEAARKALSEACP
jgi:tetratricopeptide (TPR) repeat protein